MVERKHKAHWWLVAATGIVAIIIGTFLDAYAIIIVEKGPFPVTGTSFIIEGSLLWGFGTGYLICTIAIRSLEKKIKA